jgi:hypothetical protein
MTGLAKRPDAKPDQIDRACEFQDGKQLGACKNDRRDADPACNNMDESAERGPKRRRNAGSAAAGQRSRRDVENPGAGNRGDDERGKQKQQQICIVH